MSVVRAKLSDEERLQQLGHKQELRRELTSFANFGMAFSSISILTGFASLLGDGLSSGGPVVIIWGWPLVAMMTMAVAASMAEICSSYPVSGGMYLWSAIFARNSRYAGYISWMTAWLGQLGQFTIFAAGDFGLAAIIDATVSIASHGRYIPTDASTLVIYIVLVIIHGTLNTFGVRLLQHMNTISVWWHILGTLAIICACLAGAPTKQSPQWVFTQFENRNGWDNYPFYAALLGLLMSQYTFTGYDSSAQVAEETKNANVAGPAGVVTGVLVSFVAGWPLLIALLFSIQDYQGTINSSSGSAIVQIFLDCLGVTGAVVLSLVVAGAMFFSSVSSLTACSRMLYAMARDKAVPGSSYVATIHSRWKSPVYSIWTTVFVSIILGLPTLVNSTLFTAITSLTTIALYVSYGIPILCYVLNPQEMKPGPFHLGRLSRPIGAVATLWIAFITVLFMLPKENPVTAENMNYAGGVMALVAIAASLAWMCGAGNEYWRLQHKKVENIHRTDHQEEAVV